jgi:hypothetical protein
MLSRRRKTAKANKRHEKRQSQAKWQEKLKINTKAQNQHKNSKSTHPLKSTPPNTLNGSSPP